MAGAEEEVTVKNGNGKGSGDDEAEGENQVLDITESPAFKALEELVKQDRISLDMCEHFKAKYAKLHDHVVDIFEEEKVHLKQAKSCNQESLAVKIKYEKNNIQHQEELQVVANLEKEKTDRMKELQATQDKEIGLDAQLQEIERMLSELEDEVAEIKAENKSTVEPELNRVREDIAELEEQVASKDGLVKAESSTREELAVRVNALENELKDLQVLQNTQKQLFNKAQLEPERAKKQAEIVEVAAGNLEKEVEVLITKLRESDEEMTAQQEKKKEVSEVCRDLKRKLDLHRCTIEQRERDVQSVKRSLDLEKSQHQDLLGQKIQQELRFKERRFQQRTSNAEFSHLSKEYDASKRLLKRRMEKINSIRSQIPELEQQVDGIRVGKDLFASENAKYETQIEDLKQEVDIFIANFLKQESQEKQTKGKLEEVKDMVKKTEELLALWIAEESRQMKQIALLSAKRERKAREASKASRLESRTRKEQKVKQLVIFDLGKKSAEVNSRQREFSALYDVVKNERNKYVNYIQASSQASAEMREKIRILQSEVEILRNESQCKDTALSNVKLSHHSSQCERDTSRLEVNRFQAKYREKQREVEHLIVEVDKLNSVINSMERDMLRLKKQYGAAIEQRNYNGVLLVDRNDELCVLYEKSNVQQEALKKGQVALQKFEDSERLLKLQIREVDRKIELARRKLDQIPILRKRKDEKELEFIKERELTEKLCEDLEVPERNQRWRTLPGEDPDPQQLEAKIEILQERVNKKKEAILEKELALEELTTLSQKLKERAESKKSETMKIYQHVNEFQSQINGVTREMMATVSEMSMYQATALKLEQEKCEKEAELEDAEIRFRRGDVPSEDARIEWIRMEEKRMELLRRHHQSLACQGSLGMDSMGGNIVNKKSTASPRPNAYIPEGKLALPKPYGGSAPFKPTECGSNMRHIRKPVPREIEI